MSWCGFVRAETKINQLIETLDMHKDECIERTFKVRGGGYSL